jgi:hypothetical protein
VRSSAKGLLLGGLHLALVAALGGKLLVDRARYPRVWVRAAPVDPDLPLRGRYVRMQVQLPGDGGPQTIACFIPGQVPDPSLRPPGEELWVEVTVPPRGPVRPIRLAVRKDGLLVPIKY